MAKIWTKDNLKTATDDEQTQMPYVYATWLFRNQEQAGYLNDEAVKDYQNKYQQYAISMDNHPELNPKPPMPPFKWVVVEQVPGEWSSIEQSTELVCQPMIYIPVKKPNLAKWLIGKRYYPGNDTFFYALPGDITPNFEENDGVSADGVKGRFKKYVYIQSSPGEHDITGIFIKIG